MLFVPSSPLYFYTCLSYIKSPSRVLFLLSRLLRPTAQQLRWSNGSVLDEVHGNAYTTQSEGSRSGLIRCVLNIKCYIVARCKRYRCLVWIWGRGPYPGKCIALDDHEEVRAVFFSFLHHKTVLSVVDILFICVRLLSFSNSEKYASSGLSSMMSWCPSFSHPPV